MKKWITYSVLTILVLLIIGGLYVLKATSYKGNQQIIIWKDKPFTSLADELKRPEFKNNVVYIDIWGTTCPPCFEELQKYSPLLTNHYKNTDDIAFLYICMDRHPLPQVRWKQLLKELKPKGYHVLVRGSTQEEITLANEVVGKPVNDEFFPYIPFYIIIDKHGKIVGKPTANPNLQSCNQIAKKSYTINSIRYGHYKISPFR